MNKERHFIYTRKVNLAVLLVYYTVISLYLLGNLFTGMGIHQLLEVTLLALAMLLIPTILHMRRESPYLVRIFIYLAITLYVYYNLFRAQDLGNFRALFVFFQALIIISLYVEKNHLLFYASLLSIINSIIYFLFPQTMVPVDLSSFLQFKVGFIASTLLLYLMTLWGNELLENSEECWRYALKGSGDGVWDWNFKDGIIFHSHSLVELIGDRVRSTNSTIDDLGYYKKNTKDPHALMEDELGEWRHSIHPQDVEKAFLALQGHLNGETPFYEAEYRVKDREKTYRWIGDRGRVLLRHRDGTPLRMVGTSADISRRKKNEEQIKLYTEELQRAHDRIKEDILKAQRLHEQFLPNQLPEIEGYSFASYYQPAKSLGGDFYNVIYRVYALQETVLFYLADVSGHGLDGALLNIFLRETINSYLIHHQEEDSLSPSYLLQYVAEQYSKEFFPDDYFICLMIGLLDIPSKTLTYSGTGFQLPPLVMTKEGEWLDVKFGGLPISKAIDLNLLFYEEESFSLVPDSCCLFTTDGIIEEETKGELYGIERLKEILKENKTREAKEILSTIHRDFMEFTENKQGHDDITCLLIKAIDK